MEPVSLEISERDTQSPAGITGQGSSCGAPFELTLPLIAFLGSVAHSYDDRSSFVQRQGLTMNVRTSTLTVVALLAAIATIAVVLLGGDLNRWLQTGLLAVGVVVVTGSIGALVTQLRQEA